MNNIILRKLEKLGLKYKVVTIVRPHGKTGSCIGIMVYHDYYALYPSKWALDMHNKVTHIANAAGLYSSERGHYSATLIYC